MMASTTTATASSTDATLHGDAPFDGVGLIGLGGGDLTGDGVDDLVVGSAGGGVGGVVHVYNGPVLGTLSPLNAGTELVGGDPGIEAPVDCLLGGDLDDDGASDLAVCHGRELLMFPGPLVPGSIGLETAPIQIRRANLTDVTNAMLAGDLTGDGAPDLLVGDANGYYGPYGQVYLVPGPLVADGNISDATIGFYGSDIDFLVNAAGGDWDGDGADDLVLGAPVNEEEAERPGRLYFIPGPISGWSSAQDAATFIYRGLDEGTALGSAVVNAGDINADGLADFLVGSDSGDAWLLYGSARFAGSL